MKLLPAILTDSMTIFTEQLEIAKQGEQVDTVHIDVVDGMFADTLTLTPLDLAVVDFGELQVDFHLMTEEPMDFVHECEAVREYLPIRRIIGQIERMSSQRDFVAEVKRNGWQPALGLDIFTPIDSIDEDVWGEFPAILIMGIEAGAQNKVFNPHALEKIQELRQKYPNLEQLNIGIDGGVKIENLKQILETGVDEVMVGSAIWKSDQPVQLIDQLHEVAGQ
mgnify:CR=1 FL=1